MKFAIKIITALSSVLVVLESCQRQDIETPVTGSSYPVATKLVPVVLTADYAPDQTKVSYTETSSRNLHPAWQKDDVIIGFDENKNTYSFTVTSVDSDGKAELQGEAPTNCTLHLIYIYGARKDKISEGSVTVSYANQDGDNTVPAVMLADGSVSSGNGSFHFSNAGAVIGIDAVKGVPAGSTISKITVSGSNLSAATIALDGTTLKLTATEKVGDSISTGEGFSAKVSSDGKGTLKNAPVLIAVPAGAEVSKVSVTTDNGTFVFMFASPATLAANQYTYIVGQTFVDPYLEHEYVDLGLPSGLKWATCNIGASNPEEYGWYFSWAGTMGYVFINNFPSSIKWVSAKNGTTLNYGFCWGNNPYQTKFITGYMEEDMDYDELKFTKYLGSTTSEYKDPSATDKDALKTVLDPEDDAAHVNWGGSWRMPTKADFDELIDNTTNVWTDNYEDMGVGGRIFTSKSDANKSIFFPAIGYGSNSGYVNDSGNYWSSSLSNDCSYGAYSFGFYKTSGTVATHGFIRKLGFPVRAVSD